jgi:hypothetical protein
VSRDRSISLAPELDSVTTGRHFVRDLLLGWDLGAAVEDASLAVTELIANAVKHARSAVRVRVAVDDDILVSVCDAAPALRPARPPGPLAESGRGLQIVAAVSRAWGIEPAASGKCLWFRLPLPASVSPVADTDATVLALPATSRTAARRRAQTAG